MPLPYPSDLATYGGKLQNYHPIANPQTDRDDTAVNQALTDVSMMTRMCPRAWAQFTAGAAPALSNHDAMWGKLPPVSAPVVARTGAGIFTITWPVSVIDPLGVTQTINFRFGLASVANSAAKHSVQVVKTSANIATVYTFDAAGAAADISVAVDVLMF